MQRFKVAVPTEAGGTTFYPMTAWLVGHPEGWPSDFDPTSLSSRQIRGRLKKAGWIITETAQEVRLMPPEFGETTAATALVGEATQDAERSSHQDDYEEAAEVAFRMEQQLQHFVADNLHTVSVNGRRVRPLHEQDGRSGLEYQTAVGRIDLLALDDAGGLVIFEFKRAKASDATIGQLTRYMGCIKDSIGADREVCGVIVAPTISDDLRYSARIVPNVHLFEFEMSFALRPAHEVAA